VRRQGVHVFEAVVLQLKHVEVELVAFQQAVDAEAPEAFGLLTLGTVVGRLARGEVMRHHALQLGRMHGETYPGHFRLAGAGRSLAMVRLCRVAREYDHP
jgi:hypothetical protein